MTEGKGSPESSVKGHEIVRAARAGASIDRVLDVAHHAVHHVNLRGAFDTLDYLERGGCIGKAEAFLGSLLKGNSVIGMKDGEVFPYARERSLAKAIDYLYDFAANFGDVEGLAVEYTADFGESNGLVQRLRSKFPQLPLFASHEQARLSARTQGPVSSLLACLKTGKTAGSSVNPIMWWAIVDSNHGPQSYQDCALTN